MNAWDYGRGNGPATLVAIVLLLAWPLLFVALPAAFVWFVVWPTAKALWRHRLAVAVITAVVVPAALVGVVETTGFVTGLALAAAVQLVVLRLARPDQFARYVADPWSRHRRRRRLAATWPTIAVGHGLGHVEQQARRFRADTKRVSVVPGLKKVAAGPCIDRLTIRPLYGQTAQGWAKSCDALALAYGAVECRTGVADPEHLYLDIVRRDPLATVVPALDISERVDLAAVPVGLCEDGSPWTVRLEGNHLLVAGSSGAGKGSVLWSLLRALGPGIRDGLVQVWAVDPKGGQELYAGRRLFHAYADDNPTAMVELLEEAAAAMEARSKRYRSRLVRKHRTTPAEPLVVVVVDELADLTTLEDRKLRDRAVGALSTLLRKGRAVGYVVVAAVQDPTKDVVPFRQLIPTRIGLRLAEKSQVAMVLGEGAREAGAYCDRIPHPGAEGVAYALVPHRREPVRVRAGWVTDNDISDLADRYPAPINLSPGLVDQGDDHDGGPDGGTPTPLPRPTDAVDHLRDAA